MSCEMLTAYAGDAGMLLLFEKKSHHVGRRILLFTFLRCRYQYDMKVKVRSRLLSVISILYIKLISIYIYIWNQWSGLIVYLYSREALEGNMSHMHVETYRGKTVPNLCLLELCLFRVSILPLLWFWYWIFEKLKQCVICLFLVFFIIVFTLFPAVDRWSKWLRIYKCRTVTKGNI